MSANPDIDAASPGGRRHQVTFRGPGNSWPVCAVVPEGQGRPGASKGSSGRSVGRIKAIDIRMSPMMIDARKLLA
jgi:hypothetical protein